MKVWQDYRDIPLTQWKWGPYFSPVEMRCRGTNKLIINAPSLDKLLALRIAADFAFPITSAGRDPDYNDKISSTGTKGPHTEGQAFDVAVYGAKAFWLVTHAADFGFVGIGVKQAGPYEERFIHIDDYEEGPRPRVWSY